MSGQQLSDLHFSSLDLEPTLQAGLKDAGFTRCTPIQAGALPIALAGSDVAGQAQTGSGKTAAFLLSTMNHLMRHAPPDKHTDGQPRAIMLAPTRELAIQIHRDAEMLGKHTGLRTGLVYGGTGYDSQREMLKRGLDILIGTPGRLIDYFKQRVFGLKSVQIVVLDEADRMFDLGFIRDIRYLLRRMPPATERINMLFSATLSERVRELAYEHMNAPQVVDASPEQVTVDTVTQTLYHVSKDEKIRLLVGLLRRSAMTRTIVFVNTKRVGEKIDAYLEANGLFAGLLSGDVPQNKRTRLLERFSRGEVPILVATDVAARGLHIPDVSHVINFDLPQDSEDYVHRIGRTARAGASGDAVSFACEEYVFSLEDIEDYIGAKIPTARVDDDLMPELKTPARRPRSGPRTRSRPGKPRSGDGKGGEPRRSRRRSGQRSRG